MISAQRSVLITRLIHGHVGACIQFVSAMSKRLDCTPHVPTEGATTLGLSALVRPGSTIDTVTSLRLAFLPFSVLGYC